MGSCFGLSLLAPDLGPGLYAMLRKLYTLRMRECIQTSVCDARQASGVTQEELARAVGVTRQTIIAIEKGNYTPSVLLAMKIAAYFKKSVETLFIICHES